MKTIILSALTSLGLAAPAMADPIFGVWQTEPDDGAYSHVEMKQCGEVICGVFVRTFDSEGETDSGNIGKQVVRDMTNKGGGEYAGKAWRPSNDRIYIGKAQLNGDQLRMKGCVLGGLICFGQTWTRVN